MGLDKPEFNAQHLNEGQRAAGRHILNSWDRVMLVSGPPGAGKTRMWQELAPEIERQAGLKVFAFAPSSDASRETLRQEGFLEANTVEHMLCNEVLQRRMRGQVIWIDEAGLLGMEDM
jgi:Ni2+-binding GTPase involved in maturation of urease and hydrogenase